jgi:hypothetical protein
VAHQPNWRRIKRHRAYTVWEAASITRCHRNTVRMWIKLGLPVVAGLRPFLILGTDIVEFLKQRSIRRKCKCRPGEIYCLRCRDAVAPAERMADFERQTDKIGRLVGLCPNCGTVIYRCVSVERLGEAMGSLDVQFRTGHRRITNTAKPLLIVD